LCTAVPRLTYRLAGCPVKRRKATVDGRFLAATGIFCTKSTVHRADLHCALMRTRCSVQQRRCGQAGELAMLQSFPLPDGLDAGDIEMLWLMGAAFMPSILGLLLALLALWLPDDGPVLSQQCDGRQHE